VPKALEGIAVSELVWMTVRGVGLLGNKKKITKPMAIPKELSQSNEASMEFNSQAKFALSASLPVH
jgi:hypothetical protein